MSSHRSFAALAWLRLIRVAQKVSHAGAVHIAKYDLSDGLYDVLSQIATDEGLTQQEIADQLLVTKGNVSQLLTKLEKRGFIEKRKEGRSKYIYLTPNGREILSEIQPKHDEFIRRHFSYLNEDELKQLYFLLRKLDKHLK